MEPGFLTGPAKTVRQDFAGAPGRASRGRPMNVFAVLLLIAGLSCAGCADSDPRSVAEVAGLSAPAETGAEQQQRQQGIFDRADSLIISTIHLEAVLPDATHRFREVTECSGPQCERLNPTTGETDTSSLGEAEIVLGDAEALGSAHGITLTSGYARHETVAGTAFGAWMEHSYFGLHDDDVQGEDAEFHVLRTTVIGELTDRPLDGSATWLGLMVGTSLLEGNRGDRLAGTAALNYDLSTSSLDAAFSGIKNVDRGRQHSTETVLFSDLEVGSNGTFSRGQSGARIQGSFYGPEHAEAAGIFEHHEILGAFGAKKQ